MQMPMRVPERRSVPKTGVLPSANTADDIKRLRIAYNTFVDQNKISGVGAGVPLKLEFLKEQFARIIPDRVDRSGREGGKGKSIQQAADRFVEKIKPSFVSWGMDKEFRELAEAAVRFEARVVPPEPSAPPLSCSEKQDGLPPVQGAFSGNGYAVYPSAPALSDLAALSASAHSPEGVVPDHGHTQGPISPVTPPVPPPERPFLVKPNNETLVEEEVQKKLDILSAPVARIDKEYAVAALFDYSRDKAYGDALIKADGGTQLIGLLSGDATEQAKDYAAKALLNLSSDSGNRKALVDAGVYAKLEKLINNSKAEPSARAYARGAAMNFLSAMPSPIETPQPVGNLLNNVTGVANNALETVKEAFGTVQEGVVAALDTAQNKVANGVNLLRGWFK